MTRALASPGSLAAGAPVESPRRRADGLGTDSRSTSPTGPTDPPIDPQAAIAPGQRCGARRSPKGVRHRHPLATAEVRSQESARRSQQLRERRVGQSIDAEEGVDANAEEHLAAVDVPDAGHETLIEEHLRDASHRGWLRPDACHRLTEVGRRIEQVGAELCQPRVQRQSARLEQLDGRRVEADHRRGRRFDDRHRAGRIPAPALARSVAMPRAMHLQVRVQRQAVAEIDEQMLATRRDAFDVAADDALELRSAWPAARGDDLIVSQRVAHDSGDAVDGVAFGHQASSTATSSMTLTDAGPRYR